MNTDIDTATTAAMDLLGRLDRLMAQHRADVRQIIIDLGATSEPDTAIALALACNYARKLDRLDEFELPDEDEEDGDEEDEEDEVGDG